MALNPAPTLKVFSVCWYVHCETNGIKLWGFNSMQRGTLVWWSSEGFMHTRSLLQRMRSKFKNPETGIIMYLWVKMDAEILLEVLFVLFFKLLLLTWTWQLLQTELRSALRSTIKGCVLLSDVLQDIKDELYHKRLVASLAPPAGYDGSQHVIQDVEVLGRERLPIAPSHKTHLKIQTIKFSHNLNDSTFLCYV